MRPGGPPTSRSLIELLSGVDEPTFNHVFAFGLREIQQLGTLTDTQAAHWLYDLTLGADHVSLADVMERLEAWRGKLLGDDEKPALVNQLLVRREQLQVEIEELRELTGRYFESVQSQRHLAASIDQLQKTDQEIEHRLWVAGMARTLADKWHARAALEQQLKSLGNVEPLPEGALDSFNELRDREAQFVGRVDRLRNRRLQLRRDGETIDANIPLCKASAPPRGSERAANLAVFPGRTGSHAGRASRHARRTARGRRQTLGRHRRQTDRRQAASHDAEAVR